MKLNRKPLLYLGHQMFSDLSGRRAENGFPAKEIFSTPECDFAWEQIV
jgi:hypothetical protein